MKKDINIIGESGIQGKNPVICIANKHAAFIKKAGAKHRTGMNIHITECKPAPWR